MSSSNSEKQITKKTKLEKSEEQYRISFVAKIEKPLEGNISMPEFTKEEKFRVILNDKKKEEVKKNLSLNLLNFSNDTKDFLSGKKKESAKMTTIYAIDFLPANEEAPTIFPLCVTDFEPEYSKEEYPFAYTSMKEARSIQLKLQKEVEFLDKYQLTFPYIFALEVEEKDLGEMRKIRLDEKSLDKECKFIIEFLEKKIND